MSTEAAGSKASVTVDGAPMSGQANRSDSYQRGGNESGWSQLRRWLRPLSNGPQEIAALDGLRALAALCVLIYHAMAVAGAQTVIAGYNLTWTYFYTESGVDLFFILSGFLLFLPYSRAILNGRPLPRATEFYRRRALRILPAYYVCLGVMAVAVYGLPMSTVHTKDVLAHVALLHDIWPTFNRTISGPFWTLAVEWQFYLVLPLIAWAIARISGGSPRRLVAGVVGVIIVALAIREADALVAVQRGSLSGNVLSGVDLAQRILIGSQGKYLEVFGIGMLCGVIYTLAQRAGALANRQTRLAGLALLGLALVTYLIMAPEVYVKRNAILAAGYLTLRPTSIGLLCGPLFLGVGYGALVLGVLLAPRAFRAPFEWGPLRFIGLISYSLYLWHETILNVVFPLLPNTEGFLRGVVAVAVGLGVGIPFAYVSYQLVERPFLRLRRSSASRSQRLAPQSAIQE